jgi:hypothetical protein
MEVELPALIEKGLLYVLLQQEGSWLFFVVLTVLEYLPQFLHNLGCRQQLHLMFLIGTLSRFDEPQLLLVLQHSECIEVNVGA